jgi:hypothetical protein
MVMTYAYTIYSLTLQTPFPCPILPLAPAGTTPDVVVSYGRVPRHLPDPVAEGPNWEVAAGCYLWRGGNRAGRFLVEGEQRVTVERNPDAKDPMLAFHLLDSVLAAVLRHRGLLVLHSNAAVTPSGAVVVSGESGTGKSTILATLLVRGCSMLTDDITALQLDSAGQVVALPGIPQLHLTEEAAEELGQDISDLPRYPWKRMKAAVPATDVMAVEPAPLRAIYMLDLYDQDELGLESLAGGDKFAALQDCVYGPMLPNEHPGLFHLFAAVAEQTTIYRLTRPAETWTVDQIADIILNGQTP